MTKLRAVLLTVLTILSVEALQAACLTLTWTAPGDDGYSGIAAQYDIRMSTSPLSADNWDQASSLQGVPRPGAAGANQAFLVAGLVSGTTYFFGLRTIDERDNWSGISNIAMTTAPDDRCQGSVGNVNCGSDGIIDISDVATIVDHLFLSLRPLCCPGEADISLDGGNVVDISDISALIYYLFIGATETPACPAE
ncbi:MAG: hypothetical protein GY867_03070 [bacterium]|nr:hypothetical protein [bacterium]